MAWVETTSPSFSARHAEADADDVVGVLELLEGTRERLAGVLPVVPRASASSSTRRVAQLDLAQPVVPLLRRLTAPASRRYMAGWFTPREIHVLAPRLLEARASNVPGSREMLLLTPGRALRAARRRPQQPGAAAAAAARRRSRATPASPGSPPAPASGSPGRRRTRGRRSRAACARAASRRSRPGIRDAQLLGGIRARPARARGGRGGRGATRDRAARRHAAHARARVPRPLVRPHAGRLARAPGAARRAR